MTLLPKIVFDRLQHVLCCLKLSLISLLKMLLKHLNYGYHLND